jgi:hypothetical protein
MEIIQEVKFLMRSLYCKIGCKAIELAKKLEFPYVSELEVFASEYKSVLPFENFPEALLCPKFDFLSKYCGYVTGEMDQLKINSLNAYLREMLEDTKRDGFVEGDYRLVFIMLVGCSRRHNHTTNKLIFGIVNNLS